VFPKPVRLTFLNASRRSLLSGSPRSLIPVITKGAICEIVRTPIMILGKTQPPFVGLRLQPLKPCGGAPSHLGGQQRARSTTSRLGRLVAVAESLWTFAVD
jgi:hypothetical protein